MTRLLVINGYPLSQDTQRGEVIDVADSTLTCDDFAAHPLKAWASVGGLLNKKDPLVCGGWVESKISTTDDCFVIGQSGAVTNLLSARGFSASVVLNETTLMVTGGSGLTGDSEDTTEFVSLDSLTTSGRPMPSGNRAHCLVAINSTYVLMIGGEIYGQNTYWYSIPNDLWTEGPKLTKSRSFHGCALFESQAHDGNPVIIVTGGSSATILTEMLDLGAQPLEWTAGKSNVFFSTKMIMQH